LLQIQTAIVSELEKAQKALGQPQQFAESGKFAKLFKELWKKLTSGLENLLTELSKQIDNQDIDFEKSVKEAIQKCKNDTKIPTNLKDIEDRRDAEGASYQIAYNKYLNEIRAHLTQHFLSLDEGLKNSLERVKSQVTNVLINEGKLGGITEARGSEFLKAIEQMRQSWLATNTR
jgi:hypothetical protein